MEEINVQKHNFNTVPWNASSRIDIAIFVIRVERTNYQINKIH